MNFDKYIYDESLIYSKRKWYKDYTKLTNVTYITTKPWFSNKLKFWVDGIWGKFETYCSIISTMLHLNDKIIWIKLNGLEERYQKKSVLLEDVEIIILCFLREINPLNFLFENNKRLISIKSDV